MENAQLNEFSQQVYDFLKLNFPSYVEHIEILPCAHFGDNYIKFKVEPPNRNASYWLTFDTNDNVITLCFDNCHCHYLNLDGLDFETEMRLSIETFENIIKDKLMSVSFYRGETHVMSALKERTYLDDLNFNSPELSQHQIDKVVCKSWTGSHDGEKIMK